MGFEEAIASTGFNEILYAVLYKFLSELRPYPEEPTTPDNVNAVLQSVVVQFCAKTPLERTVWWMESSKTNAHPFVSDDVDFFAMSWQDKLVVLRQLVDWQLAYSNVKEIIDIAWEVKYQRKKKKTNKTLAAEFAPPDEDDPMSINNLRMVALGQDSSRIRYWVVDDSPRVWASPNPWRMNCPMTVVATTRDEYAALVKKIRDTAPAGAEGTKTKLTKPQQAHVELLPALEARFDAIDAHAKYIEALRRQRQEEMEEDEETSVADLVDEERELTERGSRIRGRSSAQKSEDDEMEGSEENVEPGPSTSKGRVKGRSSTTKKAVGKKRKREPSPTPSESDEDSVDPLEAFKWTKKDQRAVPAARRKLVRDAKPTKAGKVEDGTATPAAKNTTKSKAKAVRKSAPASPVVEEAATREDESLLEGQPRPALGTRRSARNSTTRAPTTQAPEDDDEGAAAATSSVSSGPKKPAPSRPVGSRRSGRFAKPDTAEMDLDAKSEAHSIKAETTSGEVPAPNDTSAGAKGNTKVPPRKKTRTTRQSQAQAEDKMESASASTFAEEDVREKMDVEVSSTDTASPIDTSARKKLPPSESGDTTPVNPSRSLGGLAPLSPSLGGLAPLSPVMKAEWVPDSQTTSETVPAVAAN
ncbi:hypothetical protein FRC04_008687 [Tulasnella sp. 424]|nr:hypothetical protein FRC04_008687 [Tulasnella sp. 424]KAG8979919.1 hypothetical protein FRC05_007362 [Tulasnella sp. 425]